MEVDLERLQSGLVRTTGGRFIAGSGPTWSLQGRERDPGGMVDQVHAGPSWAILAATAGGPSARWGVDPMSTPRNPPGPIIFSGNRRWRSSRCQFRCSHGERVRDLKPRTGDGLANGTEEASHARQQRDQFQRGRHAYCRLPERERRVRAMGGPARTGHADSESDYGRPRLGGMGPAEGFSRSTTPTIDHHAMAQDRRNTTTGCYRFSVGRRTIHAPYQ